MFFPRFSSWSFMMSGLMVQFLIHFEQIFVSGIKQESDFILLHVDIQFCQHHLSKKLYFLHWVFLALLSNICWLYTIEFISGLSILSHWSVCLFLYQCHTVLITVALQYSLKSGSVMAPALRSWFLYDLIWRPWSILSLLECMFVND